MSNYFCGWYFRCQSDSQALAIIPSVHKTVAGKFCSVQIITDHDAFQFQLPHSDYHPKQDAIQINGNQFSPQCLILDLNTPEQKVHGSLYFSELTPIRYDIMGPFRYIPFLQCRHTVFSMRHFVNGEIKVNDRRYIFQNGIGYMEGDRGRSFPKRYLWTQCSFDSGSLMLSVADIPLMGLTFTGIIAIVLLDGKEYRLATYLGARLEKATKTEIIIRQGKYRFILRPGAYSGQPLHAPVNGAMTRTIYEHLSCHMDYSFERDGTQILALRADNAAFEYEF